MVGGKVDLGLHITSESWLLEGERSLKEREDDILALDKIPHSHPSTPKVSFVWTERVSAPSTI